MKIKIKNKLITLLLFTLTLLINLNSTISAEENKNQDLGPWSVMLYGGGTAKQTFGKVISGHYSSFGENIFAIETAYTLDQENTIRKFFNPVFDVVQFATNFAYRYDFNHNDNVKEGNIYLIWRFTRFPWNNYLNTSLGFGEGVSFDSHPPYANIEPNSNPNNFSKTLNYLMIEATFALPSHPSLELVTRLHHSCTAWGTFPKNANAGSTNIGLGIRYYL